METNMIRCWYGKHTCERTEFTERGINYKYRICKKCKSMQMIKYRKVKKYRDMKKLENTRLSDQIDGNDDIYYLFQFK